MRLYPLQARATFDGRSWRLILPRRMHTCDVCFRPVGPTAQRRAAWVTPPDARMGEPKVYRCQTCGPEAPPGGTRAPTPAR